MKRDTAKAYAGKTKRKKGSGWMYRGLTEDAKKLGVSRSLLYLAVSGRREKPELLARYNQLKAKSAESETKSNEPHV